MATATAAAAATTAAATTTAAGGFAAADGGGGEFTAGFFAAAVGAGDLFVAGADGGHMFKIGFATFAVKLIDGHKRVSKVKRHYNREAAIFGVAAATF